MILNFPWDGLQSGQLKKKKIIKKVRFSDYENERTKSFNGAGLRNSRLSNMDFNWTFKSQPIAGPAQNSICQGQL